MNQNFVATFLFEIQYPLVDQALPVVRQKVFKEAPKLPLEKEEDECVELSTHPKKGLFQTLLLGYHLLFNSEQCCFHLSLFSTISP
jgi:hypothetical protein